MSTQGVLVLRHVTAVNNTGSRGGGFGGGGEFDYIYNSVLADNTGGRLRVGNRRFARHH